MITINPREWRLYVIADPKLHLERTHLEIARAAITGGADVIQLRDKTSPTSHLLETAFEIRNLAAIAYAVEQKIPTETTMSKLILETE